jgi:hypothetical protein
MFPKQADTKQVDSKGRLTLGERFAGRVVIVRETDETELVITLARVIPEREAWLYENSKAKQMVFTGIEQAKKKKFVSAPDLHADEELARKIGDDEA